jgi:DNA-binding LytR/AlgR family response regulator
MLTISKGTRQKWSIKKDTPMKQYIANEEWSASQEKTYPFTGTRHSKTGGPAFDPHRKFIPIKGAGTIERIELEQISFITVEGDCCTFCFDDQGHRSCSQSLKSLQKLLSPVFIRINRNYLVNSFKIKKLLTKERKIILLNGEELVVSCRSLALLKERLSQDM